MSNCSIVPKRASCRCCKISESLERGSDSLFEFVSAVKALLLNSSIAIAKANDPRFIPDLLMAQRLYLTINFSQYVPRESESGLL